MKQAVRGHLDLWSHKQLQTMDQLLTMSSSIKDNRKRERKQVISKISGLRARIALVISNTNYSNLGLGLSPPP